MKETKRYQICLVDGTNFMFGGEQANEAHKILGLAGIHNGKVIDLKWDKEQIEIFTAHIMYAKKLGDWGNTNDN